MGNRSSERLRHVAVAVSRAANNIGVGFLMVMMLVTVADVATRYFESGFLGAYEVVEFTMIATVFLCIGFCQVDKSNVAVELLYDRLSPWWKRRFDLVNALVPLLLFSIFVYASLAQVMDLRARGSTSGVLLWPMYPIEMVVAVGYVILCLVLLSDLVGAWAALGRRETKGEPR